MKKKNIIVSIVSVIVVALLGTLFTQLGMDWFGTLNLPSQWIPAFIFPVVWSIIYISFGVVLYLWQANEKLNTTTTTLLIINGVLNVLWCLVFFTLHLTFLGNVVIVINTIFAYLLVADIIKQKRIYGLALSLYPIWLSLATTLNLAVWILN